jgi:hypothetical protein
MGFKFPENPQPQNKASNKSCTQSTSHPADDAGDEVGEDEKGREDAEVGAGPHPRPLSFREGSAPTGFFCAGGWADGRAPPWDPSVAIH